jgi:hypothetical protein
MPILGAYTGDINRVTSYLWGLHWDNHKGYRVLKGIDIHNHYFGDSTWNTPLCKLCHKPLHQILTLDLNDNRLSEVRAGNLMDLPLVSCLNCSTSWETQLYKIDNQNKSIEILFQNDTQNYIADDEDKIPSPLPRTSMMLCNFQKQDIPLDETSYYKAFEYFGKDYLARVLGAPLYATNPLDRECPICKKEMTYLATIASAGYDNSTELVDNVDFFLGEMFLYFLFCKDCLCVKVECQGT